MIEITNDTIKKCANGNIVEGDGALGTSKKGFHVPRGTVIDIPSYIDLTAPFTITFWLKCLTDSYHDLYSIIGFLLTNGTTYEISYYPFRETLFVGGTETQRGYTMYGQHNKWFFISLSVINGNMYYCINGNLHSATTAPTISSPIKLITIGRGSTFQNGSEYDGVYVDNLCIHFDKFYTSQYTSPTSYFDGKPPLITNVLYVKEDNSVYKVGG